MHGKWAVTRLWRKLAIVVVASLPRFVTLLSSGSVERETSDADKSAFRPKPFGAVFAFNLFGLTGFSGYDTKSLNRVMESTRNDPQGGLITPDAQVALRGFFILGALHRVA